MDIAERIRQLRGDQTREQFSKVTGIAPQTLYKYESRTGKVSLESVEAICKSFNIRYEWLVFGREPMHHDAALGPVAYQAGPDDTDVVWVPMVDAVLSAGHGSFETSAESERKYAFRLDFISRKGNPANMVLMRVAGDSMAPEIQDNDVVLIDQSKRDIMPGKIFAVGFEESIYLKRIDNLPGKIILKSANAAYPPVELDVRGQNEDQFRIIGRVLWSGREYT